MEPVIKNRFSGPVNVFHEKRLPVTAIPAGYAALIDAYKVQAPLPHKLSAIGEKNTRKKDQDWRILTPRHAPTPTLEGQLTFALKNEGLDLCILKRLFLITGPEPIEAIVRGKPTGSYARRIWFLYEWLLGEKLNLPNVTRGAYVLAVNPKHQFATAGENSSRHRVRNNLPGKANFCPLVSRTKKLDELIALNLSGRARDIVKLVPRDLLARTAAFLLLKDSRSTYAIEGESPPQDRIQRWGRAIGEAGRQPIDLDELLRLQKIVIGDERFVKMGLRTEGGFVGEHDRTTQMPLPDHISSRHENLPDLIEGLVQFDNGPGQEIDPTLAAAILAFGFVYIHPFEDGNGRIHRYLIHHVLSERGFNPPGIVFPISSAILENIEDYERILQSYSAKILPLIKWKPTDSGNVNVLTDTADFYRYFDATRHAEFLYSCVQQTIEIDLPNETNFLRSYDSFKSKVTNFIDMPNRTIDLLFKFLHQNRGRLSKRARKHEFEAFTNDEVQAIEEFYSEAFDNLKD